MQETIDDSEVTNCGILFYSHNKDHKNSLQFLLAQETAIDGYRNSNQWSAFEGGRNADESVVDCAVRECCEESLGVVMTASQLRSALSKGSPRITLKVLNPEPPHQVRTLFLVEVPYEVSLPAAFESTRAALQTCKDQLSEYDDLSAQARELGLPTIGYPTDGVVYLDIFHVHQSTKDTIFVHHNGIENGEARLAIAKLVLTTPATEAFVKKYQRMVQLWTCVKSGVRDFQGAFTPVMRHKLLRTYAADDCYFEKQTVAWVGVDTIVKNLRPSRRNSLCFRYNFAIMISLVLEKLGL